MVSPRAGDSPAMLQDRMQAPPARRLLLPLQLCCDKPAAAAVVPAAAAQVTAGAPGLVGDPAGAPYLQRLKPLTRVDSSGEYLELNVGGEIFPTTLSTILQYPGSFLAQLMDPATAFDRELVARDAQARVFIDRPPSLFPFVLDYLRTGAAPLTGSESRAQLERLLDEARFFGLDGLVEELTVRCSEVDCRARCTAGLPCFVKVRGLSVGMQAACETTPQDLPLFTYSGRFITNGAHYLDFIEVINELCRWGYDSAQLDFDRVVAVMKRREGVAAGADIPLSYSQGAVEPPAPR
eukprot:TRINITY_DN13329_c0_g1_i1.p1 TRINITY_DN13329_c0_g1~~TRINITY_DN13329_c0_g1_i1.p1  ORF type:complete len:294 (+),score=94.50 TRINITY_DN13329_c0_g1_i1:86-967(+)